MAYAHFGKGALGAALGALMSAGSAHAEGPKQVLMPEDAEARAFRALSDQSGSP